MGMHACVHVFVHVFPAFQFELLCENIHMLLLAQLVRAFVAFFCSYKLWGTSDSKQIYPNKQTNRKTKMNEKWVEDQLYNFVMNECLCATMRFNL